MLAAEVAPGNGRCLHASSPGDTKQVNGSADCSVTAVVIYQLQLMSPGDLALWAFPLCITQGIQILLGGAGT